MITISIKLKLIYWVACHIAGTIDYRTMTAMGVAIKDLPTDASLDTVVEVSVTEDAIVSIFEKLTALPEGVAAKMNDQILDVVLAILPDHVELAVRLQTIRDRNDATASSYIDAGRRSLEPIIEVLNNS